MPFSSAHGQSLDVLWARWAGVHVGSAEVLAACPQFDANEDRLRAVRGHYASSPAAAEFERQRADRVAVLAAKMQDDWKDLCAFTAESWYGPRGLVARDYLADKGKPPLNAAGAVEGVDRPVAGALAPPLDMLKVRVARFVGVAAAIEKRCKGYKPTPRLAMAMMLAAPSRDEQAAVMRASLLFGDEVRSRFGAGAGFCGKALADYGPGSPLPLLAPASPPAR